jgi:hypothetical protein
VKAWIYVEGDSDKIALNSLFNVWKRTMRATGRGVEVIPLENKSQYFRKFGALAAEKLRSNGVDVVVGLPDLYPSSPFSTTLHAHSNYSELQAVQRKLVLKQLTEQHGMSVGSASVLIQGRLYAAALKHDCEMLLLSATDLLRKHLRVDEHLVCWTIPVENQNQDKPPSRIVESLYRTKRKRCYLPTVDTKAVLGQVESLNEILYHVPNQLNCPEFKATVDWIANKTGVPYP